MKCSIDFSIFESPTRAYGNVTGEIDLPSPPKIGDEIVLLDGSKHKIISLTAVPGGSDRSIAGLDDLVLNSELEAETVAGRMENELNLFFVPYHESE